MRDVSAFWSRLRDLGIRLRVRTDARGRRRLGLKGTGGSPPPEILAEAKALEAELLATPGAGADLPRSCVGGGSVPRPGPIRPDPIRTDPTGRRTEPPPTKEPDLDRPDRGPRPADRSWRGTVALWPIDWRRRWGQLADANEDRGEPWDVAEWRAFHETARDLAAAEARGEVPEWSYPL